MWSSRRHRSLPRPFFSRMPCFFGSVELPARNTPLVFFFSCHRKGVLQGCGGDPDAGRPVFFFFYLGASAALEGQDVMGAGFVRRRPSILRLVEREPARETHHFGGIRKPPRPGKVVCQRGCCVGPHKPSSARTESGTTMDLLKEKRCCHPMANGILKGVCQNRWPSLWFPFKRTPQNRTLKKAWRVDVISPLAC